MKKEEEIFQSLITGGLIGAALGALLSNKNSTHNSILGALAGAVILATYKANKKALQTNVPVYVEENGILFEINSTGEKKIIRKIEKPTTTIPSTFKLI